MKRQILAKLLIILGVVSLISSFVDIYVLCFPLNLSNPEWTNNIAQKLSEMAIIPLLSINLIFAGVFLLKVVYYKSAKIFSVKILGVLSLLLACLLSFAGVMYGLSMHRVQNDAIEIVKRQNKTVVSNINKVYTLNKSKIAPEVYDKYINEINNKTINKISLINSAAIKLNIKTISELFFFIIAYLLTGLLVLFPNGFKKKR